MAYVGDREAVELDEASKRWTCYCAKRMVATYEAVVAAQKELGELSAPVGGRSDGCTVVLEEGIAEGLELVLRDGRSERLVFRSVGTKTTPKRKEPARAASAAIEKAIARFAAPAALPSPDPR